MKKNRIIYYISTAVLTVLMLFSVSMYVFNHSEISAAFEGLQYPAYMVYPLAALKLMGLIAIWTKASAFFKEWAYAGFFINFGLALAAHLVAADGDFIGPILALIVLIVSYIYDKKVFPSEQLNVAS